jgi:predicted Zn-dependent peptidase
VTIATLALALALAAPGPVRRAAPPASPATAAAAPAAHRELLPGGLELVVLPVRLARTGSLRVVVRTGSAQDPPGKEGLAHVVEHALMQQRGGDGLDLLEAAALGGASANAFTRRDATTYALDAPAETFPALAERLLLQLTSPRFEGVDVARELAVIAREQDYGGDRVTPASLVEDALFRSVSLEGTVIGAPGSRERIAREDLIRFYERGYSTAAITVVLSGAVDAPAARALLSRAALLPPATADEGPLPEQLEPRLPVDERIRAPFLAAILGYRVDPGDRDACPAAAELIQARLLLALTVREPLVRAVEVGCFELRGAPFILAIAHARTIEAADLPEQLGRAFRGAAAIPPSAAERRQLELRRSRRADALRDDPLALAEAVADAASSGPRDRAGTRLPGPAGPLPAEAIRELARRTFVPERRVLVFLSPFQN